MYSEFFEYYNRYSSSNLTDYAFHCTCYLSLSTLITCHETDSRVVVSVPVLVVRIDAGPMVPHLDSKCRVATVSWSSADLTSLGVDGQTVESRDRGLESRPRGRTTGHALNTDIVSTFRWRWVLILSSVFFRGVVFVS